MFAFFTVWSLFGGMLAAISKDFMNFVKAVQTAIFWMSGIVYNVDEIPYTWLRVALKFNPVTVISSGYRKSFIYKEWFWEDKVELIGYATTFLIVFLLSLWAYKKLRKEIPDIIIRTTLITGFPGETEEQHEELVRFVEKMKFDRLGVFTYSAIEGTAAYNMPDQIDERIKEERRDELMSRQQDISAEKNRETVGRELTAFVEGYMPDDAVYAARTYAHAPDVDGYLFLNSTRNHESGDFVQCIVTDGLEYDLIGDEI